MHMLWRLADECLGGDGVRTAWGVTAPTRLVSYVRRVSELTSCD